MEKYDSEKFKLAAKRLSDATATATQAAKKFIKAARVLREAMPTAEQASKRLKKARSNKPYYRDNERY